MCDIAIITALKEEFEYIEDIFECRDLPGHDFIYSLNHTGVTNSIIGCYIGDMTNTKAGVVITQVLDKLKPKLICLIGTAGSLKQQEVKLCDVVIAQQIVHYAQGAKIEPDSDGEAHTIVNSNNYWHTDHKIVQSVQNFSTKKNSEYEHYSNLVNDLKNQLLNKLNRHSSIYNNRDELLHEKLKYHIGRIATGDQVITDSTYIEQLIGERNFLAVEMEAGGAMCATQSRINPTPLLIIRGISDYANCDKKIFDNNSKGLYREYAVKHAAYLLAYLLQWDQFLKILNIAGYSKLREWQVPEDLKANVLNRLRSYKNYEDFSSHEITDFQDAEIHKYAYALFARIEPHVNKMNIRYILIPPSSKQEHKIASHFYIAEKCIPSESMSYEILANAVKEMSELKVPTYKQWKHAHLLGLIKAQDEVMEEWCLGDSGNLLSGIINNRKCKDINNPRPLINKIGLRYILSTQ